VQTHTITLQIKNQCFSEQMFCIFTQIFPPKNVQNLKYPLQNSLESILIEKVKTNKRNGEKP
jgi:hypothetical protein